MKQVRGKAAELIRLLVETTDTITDILDNVGVGRSTYYGRRGWTRDPVFIEALQQAKSRFESELRGKLTSKRRRLEELEALYYEIPHTGTEFWQGNQFHGKTVRRVHRNDASRLRTLDQIRKEIEGDSILGSGPATPVDDSSLEEQRRSAAAEIEAWRTNKRAEATAS